MQDNPRTTGPGPTSDSEGHHSYTLAAPMLHFDLRSEAEQLRRQPSYERGDPTGKTLVKEPDLRIVLFALKAGARLDQHQASGPISIQAIGGTIRLRAGNETVELASGNLLMLEPRVPHDVDALGDAVFLLTLGRTTYQDVSDRHEPHR